MNKTPAGRWGILAAALTFTAYGPESVTAAPELSETFHQTCPLTETGRVSLDNVNGTVHITAWDRPEVQVDAVKRAKTADYLAQISIDIQTEPDSVRIRTRLPESRRGNNESGQVEYRVMVPRQARLDKINSVNGAVKLEGIGGATKASTVNGSLSAQQVSGVGSFSSVNGSVDVVCSALDAEKGLSLETVNGSVALTLPEDAQADIRADTLNGSIHNDFDLAAKKHFPVGSSLEGQLGKGGPTVKLHSVNGALRIKKGSAAR
jgi:hypothetical protein